MERGNGITFVQKGLQAQNHVGAHAVICMNHVDEPWPYTMKDSKNESSTFGLNIPVVMMKRSDGLVLKKILLSSEKSVVDGNVQSIENHTRSVNTDGIVHVQITAKPSEERGCVICQEQYKVGDKVIRLPCGHIFHEECALQWLQKHNTCPYCRKELPSDNQEVNQERIRRETEESNRRSSEDNQYDAFFG